MLRDEPILVERMTANLVGTTGIREMHTITLAMFSHNSVTQETELKW